MEQTTRKDLRGACTAIITGNTPEEMTKTVKNTLQKWYKQMTKQERLADHYL